MIYMFRYGDLADLVDWAGVYPMSNGWQVVIRAEWVDESAGCPLGLSYGLLLNDKDGNRLLGFDNSHAADGVEEDQPFDHEHRANASGRTFPYKFTSAAQIKADFFDRVQKHCEQESVPFEFIVEDE
jgi:hypothetical protein